MKETNKHIIKAMAANKGRDVVVLEPRESMDACIIGTRLRDGRRRLAYSKLAIINAFRAWGMSWPEALEFYDYNTERSLPYMESQRQVAPVIINDMGRL